MVPPTSMWTGAVYLEAAATQGMPVIFWLQAEAAGVGGVGDDEFDIVGDVAGELLGDINLTEILSTLGFIRYRIVASSFSDLSLRCIHSSIQVSSFIYHFLELLFLVQNAHNIRKKMIFIQDDEEFYWNFNSDSHMHATFQFNFSSLECQSEKRERESFGAKRLE